MKATPRIKHSCKSSPTLRVRNPNQAVPVQDQCFLPTDADIVSFINVDYHGKELGKLTLTFEPQRDFQQCGILTSVHSDEPVQSHIKLRNSK